LGVFFYIGFESTHLPKGGAGSLRFKSLRIFEGFFSHRDAESAEIAEGKKSHAKA